MRGTGENSNDSDEPSTSNDLFRHSYDYRGKIINLRDGPDIQSDSDDSKNLEEVAADIHTPKNKKLDLENDTKK